MSRFRSPFSALLLASLAVLPAHADPSRGTSRLGGGFIEFLMTGAVPNPRAQAQILQIPSPQAPSPRAAPAQVIVPDPAPPDPGMRGLIIQVPPSSAPARRVAALPDERQGSERRAASRIRAAMDPQFERREVDYDGPHAPGTIVIDTPNRFLYLVQGQGRALRYGIGVGRPGFEWAGAKTVTRKAEWPDWRPPAEMRKRRPDLPTFMAGGLDNPLGARALYLGSSLYRIHGTNEPHTIGRAVSSGCIRMNNEDVIDLYGRVRVGTRVIVI